LISDEKIPFFDSRPDVGVDGLEPPLDLELPAAAGAETLKPEPWL